MGQLIENLRALFEILVILTLFIVSVFSALHFQLTRRLTRYFSNKRYIITSDFEVNPEDHSERIFLSVYNNNVNDSRITGIGFLYLQQNIDYLNTYLKQLDSPINTRVVIPSRDGIKIEVGIEGLIKLLQKLNQGKDRISNIRCYVTDTLGTTVTVKANKLRKSLKRTMIKRRLAEIEKQKLDKANQNLTQEEEKAREKEIKKLKRQEYIDKLKQKIFKR